MGARATISAVALAAAALAGCTGGSGSASATSDTLAAGAAKVDSYVHTVSPFYPTASRATLIGDGKRVCRSFVHGTPFGTVVRSGAGSLGMQRSTLQVEAAVVAFCPSYSDHLP